MRRFALAAAFCLGAAPAFAVCPTTSLTFKDAAGTTQTLCFGGASGAFIPQYQILDSAGTNALTVTAAGAAKVDGSAVTQPVSGTVTANAGTNLNTSALALDTSVNGILNSQGSTTSGQKGPLAQGAVTTAAPSYTTAQTSPLSLTTAGALRIDGSAVTQPVSGTVTANQGGTWTVQPGNTANTTAWKVDGSAVTQPVSGTVTANAGTNLNTSALALESGGNLATIANAQGGCAGQTVANTKFQPFSLASTTALQLVAAVASKQVYICAIDIDATGGAVNVALIEGTQTTNPCDTATAGMAGGTTAATGWGFVAQGGITKGAGTGIVFRTATASHQVCLLASAATQISGSITYAQF